MNRKNFIRNITLSIACSLAPRILQPIDSEIKVEEEYSNGLLWYVYSYGSNVEYKAAYFTINDLNKIAINYYNK